ncbi:hypothetical protein EFP67_10025, partial [Lactobacillus helveticus]|nr:hypothetical protein [Lactobacillus helveticus]MCT3407834.1 hypothetical protein [Lactobacillus helveticus]MCT3418284.1 hypothetical protein [Lactobacillus helveticus]
ENRNRVLRRFIPKGQAIEELSDHKLIQINWYLNSRPLKCLNWHTPIEILIIMEKLICKVLVLLT